MDLLELNINESLKNIKENGMQYGSGGSRQHADTSENWSKGGKYGFNKVYKFNRKSSCMKSMLMMFQYIGQ